MPSHRKDRGCCPKREATATTTRAEKNNGVVVGKGRVGKRKNYDLKENAAKYLLNKALMDLEAYIESYLNWYKQRGRMFNEERLARLMDNKKILESLRDNTTKNTAMLVHTVINTVKYSLFECFDAVNSEQSEEALAKSISNLQLLHD